MPQLGARESYSQSFDKLFIARMLLDEDRDDPLVGRRDQDGGDGCLTQAVADQLAGRLPPFRLTHDERVFSSH